MNYKPQLRIWAVERAQATLLATNEQFTPDELNSLAQAYFDMAYTPEQDYLTVASQTIKLSENKDAIEFLRMEEVVIALMTIYERRDMEENEGRGMADLLDKLGINKGTAQ